MSLRVKPHLGFYFQKKTHLGVGEVGEESSPCTATLCGNDKVDAPEEKEDVAETDVSPVVREVSKIVRTEDGLVLMEERLDELGFQLDPQIVDKVLKRCFKVPHLGLRFFDWVEQKEGFCHTTKTYNSVLCIAGDAREFGLVEEMERNLCEKDVKTRTIIIQMYGKAKLVGRPLLVYDKMKKCSFEPGSVVFRMKIRALCAAGKTNAAMEFYKEMVQKESKDIGLDINMYKLLLNGIASCGDTAAEGLVSDDMMRVSQIPEHVVYGCVLKSFCISGRIREALAYVRELKNKDVMLLRFFLSTLVKGLCRADRIARIP